MRNKENLFHSRLIINYGFSLWMNSAIQTYDKLIYKPSLKTLEEMLMIIFKFPEIPCRSDQFCLHFWCDLLEEIKFFYHEVEIMEESLLHVLSYVIVKRRLYVVRSVTIFYLLYPDVQSVKLFSL